MERPLAGAFGEGLAPETGRLIEDRLAAALDEARSAFPGVELDDRGFARFVASKVDPDDDVATALAALRMPELFLCAACAEGDPLAISELERRYLGAAGQVLRRLKLTEDERDDALQTVRVRLLTPGDARGPVIARYDGRGSLAAFLRAVTLRTGQNLRRDEGRASAREDELLVARLEHEAADPELEHARRLHRPAFRAAIAHAFAALAPEQRTLLRMYLVDGLTVADLGRMHGVDKSTISRRMHAIHKEVLDAARRHLVESARIDRNELESLERLLRSGLYLSLERLLRA